jgi:hypothetical protein
MLRHQLNVFYSAIKNYSINIFIDFENYAVVNNRSYSSKRFINEQGPEMQGYITG